MIHESDSAFSRLAAVYQFAHREAIRDCIKEMSALQTFGIEKRIPQIFYRRGILSQEVIYAIFEALLRSGTLGEIPFLWHTPFTSEQENRLLGALRLVPHLTEREPWWKIRQETDLPLPPEHVALGLEIQHHLRSAGVFLPLISLLHDKNFLPREAQATVLGEYVEPIAIVDPGERNDFQVRKSQTLLLAQVALVQRKLTLAQRDRSLSAWAEAQKRGLPLRYSEVLFFAGYLERETCEKIAASLQSLSGIDDPPRFAECLLSPEEETLLQSYLLEKHLETEKIKECQCLTAELHTVGLSLRFTNTLLLKGYVAKKDFRSQQESSPSDEDHAVPCSTSDGGPKVSQRRPQPPAEQGITRRRLPVGETQAIWKDHLQESNTFLQEMNREYREEHQRQQRALQADLQQLKKERLHADAQQLKTINTVLQHYQYTQSVLRRSMITIGVAAFMLFLGFFLAFSHSRGKSSVSSESSAEGKTTPPDENLRAQYERELPQLLRSFQYEQAVALGRRLQDEILQPGEKERLAEQVQEWQQVAEVLGQLPQLFQSLQRSVPLELRRGKVALCDVRAHQLSIASLVAGAGVKETLPWSSLSPLEMYRVFAACGVVQVFPWACALFCFHHGLLSEARRLLAIYVDHFPDQEERAWQLLSQKTGEPIPPGGYPLQPRLAPAENTPAPFREETEKIPSTAPPFDEQQEFSLLSQRRAYGLQMRKRGYVFGQGRWLSPKTLEKETQARRNQGLIFFQGNWHDKKDLGVWHEVQLKGEQQIAQGFLRKSTPLFLLKTAEGNRYFAEKQIVYLKEGLSPWEQYWQERGELAAEEVAGHDYLGRWCLEQGLPDLARAQWEQVLALSPHHQGARRRLGHVFFRGKWYEDAAGEANLVNSYGQWMTQEESTRWGMRDAEAMLRGTNKKAGEAWRQGWLNWQTGNHSLTRQFFGSAIKEDGRFPLARYQRAFLYYQERDLSAALADLQIVLSTNPEFFESYLLQGEIVWEQKETEKALACVQRALQIAPLESAPYWTLARFYLATGQRAQAQSVAEKLSNPPFEKALAEVIRWAMDGPPWTPLYSAQSTSGRPVYQVFTDHSPRLAEETLSRLESMARLLAQYWAVTCPAESNRRVLVFRDLAQYRRYASLVLPTALPLETGFYTPMTREIVLCSLTDPETFWLTLHKTAMEQHFALFLSQSPVWFREGWIAYLEDLSWSEGVPRFLLTNQRLRYLAQGLPRRLIPLPVFLNMPAPIFYEGPHRLTHTLQSWAWIHFLLHGTQQQNTIPRFVGKLLLRPEWLPAWQEVTTGYSLETLQSQWLEYLQKLCQGVK